TVAAMRIAYLTGRYPLISHTFIVREVQTMRALGMNVRTFTIWRTEPRELLSEADRAEAAGTIALLPLRLRHAIRALIELFARPSAARVTIAQAWELARPLGRLQRRALAAAWVLEAATMFSMCRQLGIRHVHAHLSGTPPAVAALTATLGA